MMVTATQMKNVITFYFLELISSSTQNIPQNVSRDCVTFNKSRADICARVFNHSKYKRIIEFIHQSTSVQQINSVPENSTCSISDKIIPNVESGIQLIIRSPDFLNHVTLQKQFQSVCFAYFKVRHFTSFIQMEIRQWLLDQSWYLPKIYKTNVLLQRLLLSSFCTRIYTHYMESIYILDNVSNH
jgi:hypothetical protein